MATRAEFATIITRRPSEEAAWLVPATSVLSLKRVPPCKVMK